MSIDFDEFGYSRLILEPTNNYWEGRRIYLLTEDFHYQSDSYGIITVPKGTWTDMASVPRCFLSFVPKDGRYLHAAVIHDYMYQTAMFETKAIADEIFMEGMRKLGVKAWRRGIIWFGASRFGKGEYKQ